MCQILFVFWYAVGTAVINNMLKIHDNVPHIKGVIATRVEHKCTGQLEVFITAGGGRWSCSRLSPVCPCAPMNTGNVMIDSYKTFPLSDQTLGIHWEIWRIMQMFFWYKMSDQTPGISPRLSQYLYWECYARFLFLPCLSISQCMWSDIWPKDKGSGIGILPGLICCLHT